VELEPITVDAGTDELEPHLTEVEGGWQWAVTNRGQRVVRARSVVARFQVIGARGALRMFRHGYQSWSPCSMATLGVDTDPSTVEGVPAMARAMHHPDLGPVREHELRSEMVTVLADDSDERLLVGFDGGADHDGTLRLLPGPDGPVLEVEAYLGGAALAPTEGRTLHGFTVDTGPDHAELLERWAHRRGRAERARTGAPYQVGWCSWYHYFGNVTEADLLSNLALAGDWPFDVFQLDDGYQKTIGDWLATDETFPSELDVLADRIASAGRRPGIWLAPFLARPDAEVARANPDWIARYGKGDRELIGMWHPDWGGPTHVLDTSHPEVQEWLEQVARALVGAGFTYLKLDFTYAPGIEGVYFDAAMTPAERVRAGYEAIRRGAGDDAFLLGCGAPLGSVIGVVDGMRIGADVAPHWFLRDGQFRPGAYEDGEPATVNAWRNTLARSFMHRNLWLNDPDCVMLRRTETDLDDTATDIWARAVGVSGGMALVSDDLALLDADARRRLDEVIELGRASDAEAAAGRPARCPDLIDAPFPTQLRSATGAEAILRADLTP
jgi:alpha-galactosidase